MSRIGNWQFSLRSLLFAVILFPLLIAATYDVIFPDMVPVVASSPRTEPSKNAGTSETSIRIQWNYPHGIIVDDGQTRPIRRVRWAVAAIVVAVGWLAVEWASRTNKTSRRVFARRIVETMRRDNEIDY